MAGADRRRRPVPGVLGRQRDELKLEADSIEDLVKRLADHAMHTKRRIDRAFWVRALADVLLDQEGDGRTHLFRITARRIHNTFDVPHRDRLAAARRLAALARPIP